MEMQSFSKRTYNVRDRSIGLEVKRRKAREKYPFKGKKPGKRRKICW